MFPNKKLALRQKAMSSLMKESGPGMLMKKKPSMLAEGSPQEEAMESPAEEGKEQESEGYEQMMVTPEEKKMILEMRGESEEEGHEMPQGHSGMMAPKPAGLMKPKGM